MILIKLIKRIIGSVLSGFQEQLKFIRLQNQNPNCKFYPGVQAINSTFEGFNVLFKDVVISDSSLGVHTYIQKKSAIFNAEIGRYCSIASGVSIGPGSHKIDGVSTHPSFFLKNTPLIKVYVEKDLFIPTAKITIGHDVWIGERAIIMDGIKIGHGSIIGSGAVVTKDIEPYSIVGGVPAKHIKFRFDEETRNKLLASKWWENSEEWFDSNYSKFTDPQLLLND